MSEINIGTPSGYNGLIISRGSNGKIKHVRYLSSSDNFLIKKLKEIQIYLYVKFGIIK
jgi:hypothetical protein